MPRPNPLLVKSFTFDSKGTQLKLTANQYTTQGCDNEGLTLLFAHCVGSHKEQWEPTISRIVQLQASKRRPDRVREAWAFDWQNHGDAAVLNEGILKNLEDSISAGQWALAIEDFVNSSHLHGHRVVAIGHSAGTGAIMLTMKKFPIKNPPYKAVILVEPTMLSQELFDAHAEERYAFANATKKFTLDRRDTWPSKKAALEWLGKRAPWKSWDPRVLRLYAEYGLREVKTPDGMVAALKCDKRQEGLTYPHFKSYIEATALFRERCRAVPIHVIFGARNDFVAAYIQESLIDTSQGRIPASVTRIPDAGHMIVQEKPDALAHAICDKLTFDPQQPRPRM
ncbi:alpha/beta-hydrolase [Collybia nuda]|uniref:Alpha/beta-hydrolase n=1 Tax=Collybia nuda TaxID=64659 RepID=A0A9P5YEQ8_9AGAR|nr:alpha/beta-hydrolase [Collybia nuda]